MESLTHTNANGDVLASVTYQRNADGTPHTITREDGSYVELTYDSSLRLTQETYYSAGGVIVDEIAYTYDADGNRQSVSSGVAEGTYAYDNTTHQLSGISTNSGNESYLYDESGRVWKIIRDDETLTLSYNADDQLETVTDSTGTIVAQYTYDAEGRRIEVDGRDYVVAPMVGTNLESPHLVTNANGDVVSSYVYAGAMPLMRLDENGNPVYYLTDAMGSVIGLADGAGASTASFQYDSFGNVRSATGTATDVSAAAGGDFRFQGQWLESSTDLYNFRARYYDSETGRFISRDPVDIIETEPESSNPYQFAYNNPLIYSDPSGQITITSLQSAQQINNILERTRSAVARQAYNRFVDEAQGVVGDLLQSALSSLMPNMWMSNAIDNVLGNQQDDVFERFVRNQICGFFGGSRGSNSLASRLWFTPEIDTNGNPKSSGFNCSNQNADFFENFDPKYPNPDYLFKKGAPDATDGRPKAWLVGDMKRSIRRLHADYVAGEHSNQWKAIYNYADYSKGHQFTPLTFFIVWRPGSGTEHQIQVMEHQIAAEGFAKNVIITVAKIFG